jgi:probable F420-dependent oxidoreductase
MKPAVGFMGSGRVVDGVMPSPSEFTHLARTVDALGYDSLWVGDHLSTHNPVLEALTILTHFGAVTERVQLGTGVLLLALRQPGVLAKQVATLDWLTSGRVVMGVGVGGEDLSDFAAVGVPVSERGARTSDGILALRALWSAPVASYAGKFSSFEDIRISPQSPQPGGPPIWVGGRSPAALRRAGRLGDGWYSYMVSPRRFIEGMNLVRATAEESGRDASAIVGALLVPTVVGESRETARRHLQQHLQQRYAKHYDDHIIDNYCLAGTSEQVRERLGEYVAAGVGHVVFMHGGPTAELPDAAVQIHEEIINQPWT